MNSDDAKNEMWVSHAQKEVWEWKEALSEKLNTLPKEEQLKYIIDSTKETVEKIKAAQAERTEKKKFLNGK